MSNKEKYIANRKVINVITLDYKTPSGEDVVKVVYENDTYAVMSKKSFDLFSTDESIEPTSFREIKFKALQNEVVKVIMEYDLRAEEIVPFFSQTTDKLQDVFERASSILWTGDDRHWIPGSNFLSERTILEAEGVLRNTNDVERSEEKNNTEGVGESKPEGDQLDTHDQD